MRVPNKQAKHDAKQKCSACVSCDICEFASGCHESKIYAADLLEAREIIKEMRQLLTRIEPCDCENEICISMVNERAAIIERTKDYAE